MSEMYAVCIKNAFEVGIVQIRIRDIFSAPIFQGIKESRLSRPAKSENYVSH